MDGGFMLIALTAAFKASGPAFAQSAAVKYSQVRIYIDNSDDFAALASAGLVFDHIDNHGTYFDTALNNSELGVLKGTAWRYSILVDDMEAEYRNRPHDRDNVAHSEGERDFFRRAVSR